MFQPAWALRGKKNAILQNSISASAIFFVLPEHGERDMFRRQTFEVWQPLY